MQVSCSPPLAISGSTGNPSGSERVPDEEEEGEEGEEGRRRQLATITSTIRYLWSSEPHTRRRIVI